MAAACTGLRVLDLSIGPVGGIATMILADFGADVIKIEPPGGDPYREMAHAPVWLRGKRSRVLDLTTEAGKAAVLELAREADVAVIGYGPGVAKRLGVDAATLRAANPRLVTCTISGFGSTGPYADYPAYEGVVAAKAGRMASFAGEAPRPGPGFAAVRIGSHATSQASVQGILAALLVREQTGEGQEVETNLLQGLTPYDLAGLTTIQLTRSRPDEFPVDPNLGLRLQPTLGYQPVMTKDGKWIQLGNLLEHHFHAYIAAAGLADIYADEQLQNAPTLPDDAREVLRDKMLTRMREQTLDEWMQTFVEDGNVAAEPIGEVQGAFSHPQMIANGDMVTVETERYGAVTGLAPLARFSATPGTASAQVPEVDAHAGQGWLPREMNGATKTAATKAAGDYRKGPLSGVTVLEFATIIAAPMGGVLLGDMGARVIKVEPPEGDPFRSMGPGLSTIKTIAGKESIAVNLRTDEGREIVRKLLADADVLIQNYRPGVENRLGIGWDEVHAINPRLVYVAAMGYGTGGPYSTRPCVHPLPGAVVGGALWQNGGPMPSQLETLEEIREAARRYTRANEASPDPNTGMVVASAAMLGLWAREHTGEGQRIEVNMFRANAYANADGFVRYEGMPPRDAVDADLLGHNALYRLYQAESGWVFFACPNEREWAAFCRVAGREDLATDARFATAADRRTNDAALAEALSGLFAQRPADEWERLLIPAGVGCVRADGTMPGLFWADDPHVQAAGVTVEVDDPRWGPFRRHNSLPRFSATPTKPGPTPVVGQHSIAILRELGYDTAAIDGLITSRVVVANPVTAAASSR